MKTVIDVVLATDAQAMIKQQTKINQWRTLGLFVDMTVVATATHVVFTITRHKEVPISTPDSPGPLNRWYNDAEANDALFQDLRDEDDDIAPF